MKHTLLFTAMLAVEMNLFGQTIPNGTFENWNSLPHDEPDGKKAGVDDVFIMSNSPTR